VQQLISKVKIIVTHFRKSYIANEKLLIFQRQNGLNETPLKLMNDIPTRWNSTFYMLERFTKLETAVKSSIALIDKDLPILNSFEWRLARELCSILKPFENVTKTISGELYCTAILVIPITNGLIYVYTKLLQKDFLPPTQKLINDCLHGINERLGNVERSNTLTVSTLLDPRFKNLAFSNLSSADNARKNFQEALGEKLSGQLHKFNIDKTDDNDRDDEFSIWGPLIKVLRLLDLAERSQVVQSLKFKGTSRKILNREIPIL
jgi:hypothetical protein